MCRNIWKIAIPKEALIRLIESMDADSDGYIAVGEVKEILVRYAKDVKDSLKFAKR